MKSIFIVICLCALAAPARGQFSGQNRGAEKLAAALVASGFENVAVVIVESKMIVTYENRIYRHDARAVKEALRIALPFARGVTHLVLIPQHRKLPLVAVTIPLETTLALSHGAVTYENSASTVALAVHSDWQKLETLPRANTSLRKLDLVIYPQVHAVFGDYADPLKFQINVAPELEVSLWQGMSLSAQLIIPLHNELQQASDGVRPGVLALNQFLRLPHQALAAITLGYFTRQRYGVDLEAKKYLRNGKFSIGGNLGYTGYASYGDGQWTYSSLDLWTALANADFRWSRFDLFVRATYGKFLYQDKGWRGDVWRQFGEVEIGFYGIHTQAGTNLGFNFSIPIFPPRYAKAGTLRLRPARYFPWEYRYWGVWESGSSGLRYDTGQRLDDLMKSYQPDYITKEVFQQQN